MMGRASASNSASITTPVFTRWAGIDSSTSPLSVSNKSCASGPRETWYYFSEMSCAPVPSSRRAPCAPFFDTLPAKVARWVNRATISLRVVASFLTFPWGARVCQRLAIRAMTAGLQISASRGVFEASRSPARSSIDTAFFFPTKLSKSGQSIADCGRCPRPVCVQICSPRLLNDRFEQHFIAFPTSCLFDTLYAEFSPQFSVFWSRLLHYRQTCIASCNRFM